jgi:hypothetical protein
MTEYSTGWHVNSSINVHIIPRLGSRKLNSVAPIVVERFLDELEADGVDRGNQVNSRRPSEGSPGTGVRPREGGHPVPCPHEEVAEGR